MGAILEIFGIDILECEYTDASEESLQYENVTFFICSLSKYDGMIVEVLHDWTFKIWDEKGNVIDSFYLIENDEFKEKLYYKYPLNSNEKAQEIDAEIVFDGGKKKKRSQTKEVRFRLEVGEGSEPIISEELFNAAKQEYDDKDKLK
ncbi:hypothetical protein [Paenibacillus taichungensis]|uniref:hypothetical protein n=1 Tax=Paenibacillus taichungensis TaxID=484184 RepID=UPI0039A00643